MENLTLFLLLVGLLLIFLEIFLIPGIAVVGLIGFIMLVIGIYRVAQELGAGAAVITFVACGLIVGALFALFFRSPASKLIISQDRFSSLEERKKQPAVIQLGAHGTALTDLYPYGKASFEIEGQKKTLDVSAEASFVESGAGVVVTRVEGTRIFVKVV